MRSVYFSKFLVLLALLLAGTASAETADLNVAFVDLKRAVWESNRGKAAQNDLKNEYKSAQTKIDSQTKELEKLKDSLKAQRDSLKVSALVQKEEQLINKEKGLKRHYVDSKEALQRKEGLLRVELLRGIRKVISGIGEERKFTLILEKSGNTVLYADSGIDITDEVIKRFNASN